MKQRLELFTDATDKEVKVTLAVLYVSELASRITVKLGDQIDIEMINELEIQQETGIGVVLEDYALDS